MEWVRFQKQAHSSVDVQHYQPFFNFQTLTLDVVIRALDGNFERALGVI